MEAISVGGSDTAKPLNLAKRVKLISQFVDLPHSRILDGGCGAGEYVEALGQAGADSFGVEFVTEKVSEWQRRNPSDDRVAEGDLQRLQFEDKTFDAVLLNEVLEHVPDDRAALGEVCRVLKSGGTLVVFSPNRFHPFETHGVYSKKTGAHRGVARTFMLPWIPMAVGSKFVRYWSRNYWPVELSRMVRDAGLEISHHAYVWQTFENISGDRPGWVGKIAPVARAVAEFAERVPLIRRLGVSQLIVAHKV